MKKMLSVLLMSMLVLTLVACGGNDNEEASSKDVKNVRTDVTRVIDREPDNLFISSTASSLSKVAMQNFYDALLIYDEETDQPVGNLAEKWDVSEDGLVYTFYIKQGIKFHNGDEVTVEDVLYSLNIAKESPVAIESMGTVESIEAVGNTIVIQHSSKPNNRYLYAMAEPGTVGIINKKLHEEIGSGAYSDNPVGTGPYTMVAWEKGVKIVMKANEEYHRGPALIKDVNLKFASDETTNTIAIENGEVDYSGVLARGDLGVVDMTNLTLHKLSSDSFTYMVFNLQNEKFKDIKVREAISLAINEDAIRAALLQDTGTTAEGLYRDNVMGFDPSIGGIGYNVEEAKKALAESSYPNGFDVTIKTVSGPGNFVGQIVQSQLAEIGINVEIEIMETNAFLADCFKGKYELTFMIVNTGHFHPLYAAKMLSSTGASNIGRYSNPEMDKYLNIVSYDRDEEAVKAAVKEIQRIANEDYPIVPLMWMDGICLANKDIENLTGYTRDYYYELNWK